MRDLFATQLVGVQPERGEHVGVGISNVVVAEEGEKDIVNQVVRLDEIQTEGPDQRSSGAPKFSELGIGKHAEGQRVAEFAGSAPAGRPLQDKAFSSSASGGRLGRALGRADDRREALAIRAKKTPRLELPSGAPGRPCEARVEGQWQVLNVQASLALM